MLTSAYIKKIAKEYGASVCGIGSLELFKDEDIRRDPKLILPKAKSIIGFGFAVPKGLYQAMQNQTQYYTYATLGTSCIDTELGEIFLLKMGRIIEDAGYDACLQRAVPHLKVKGDKTTNAEVLDTYELEFASPVAEGKPAPDIIIDYNKAAMACGIGKAGLSGHILSPKYGPYIRYTFIITDAPLETDAPLLDGVCDLCGECKNACVGNAISDDGVNSWQCAVYYKGAHKSNPFMPKDFLRDHPEREQILNGKKVFDADSARALYPELTFLPHTSSGYEACLCGKKCDIVCYNHLKEKGLI